MRDTALQRIGELLGCVAEKCPGGRGVVKYLDDIKWPGVAPYIMLWGVVSLLTWVQLCLISLVILYPDINVGLVPAPVILLISVVPVSGLTLVVQTVLFVIGLLKWPTSHESNKRLVFFGTLPLSCFILWLIIELAGGVSSFVVRI